MHLIRIAVALGLLVILSACANVSRFESGAVVAHGQELNGSHEPLYYSIFLDLGRIADDQLIGVMLKLTPNAHPLQLSELNQESVAKYLPKFVPPPQWPEHWKKKAREEEAYSGGGFHIKFKNNRLQSVGICSHCAEGPAHPVIGTSDGKKFHSLPLTQQQLIEVFGQPVRVYKVNEIRY